LPRIHCPHRSTRRERISVSHGRWAVVSASLMTVRPWFRHASVASTMLSSQGTWVHSATRGLSPGLASILPSVLQLSREGVAPSGTARCIHLLPLQLARDALNPASECLCTYVSCKSLRRAHRPFSGSCERVVKLFSSQGVSLALWCLGWPPGVAGVLLTWRTILLLPGSVYLQT
jgi:hypothetical protein